MPEEIAWLAPCASSNGESAWPVHAQYGSVFGATACVGSYTKPRPLARPTSIVITIARGDTLGFLPPLVSHFFAARCQCLSRGQGYHAPRAPSRAAGYRAAFRPLGHRPAVRPWQAACSKSNGSSSGRFRKRPSPGAGPFSSAPQRREIRPCLTYRLSSGFRPFQSGTNWSLPGRGA